MAKKQQTINLLPKGELEKSPLGKFLKWALNIGRYIVIFTELIVVIGFISRFKLDLDLTNLNNEIKEKQTIVASFAQLKKKVKVLQQRLAFIKKTEKEKNSPSSIIEELSQITPLDVAFEELTITNHSINVKGRSLSNAGLSAFLNGLKTSAYFSQINLENVSSKGRKDPTLKFELSANLTKK